MHDFHCTDPDQMYYDELREIVKYLKKKPDGVKMMRKPHANGMSFEEVASIMELPSSSIKVSFSVNDQRLYNVSGASGKSNENRLFAFK